LAPFWEFVSLTAFFGADPALAPAAGFVGLASCPGLVMVGFLMVAELTDEEAAGLAAGG
jgi:hypothetical protein